MKIFAGRRITIGYSYQNLPESAFIGKPAAISLSGNAVHLSAGNLLQWALPPKNL
jgi:hypothetical protein